MAIQEKDKDFSKIYHVLIDTGILARMNKQDIKVYLVINRFANYKTLIAYPTVKTISELSGINKNDIRRTVEKLEAMGLILTTRAGERFSFRKIYGVIRGKNINPALALSIVPKNTEQCRRVAQGKDGKFRPIPENTENRIPENKEKDIPRNTDNSIPQNKESSIVPENKEKNRIYRDNIYRDRNIDKNSTDTAVHSVTGRPCLTNRMKELATKEGFFKAMKSQEKESVNSESVEDFEKDLEEKTKKARVNFERRRREKSREYGEDS